jgi:hypothetical protein
MFWLMRIPVSSLMMGFGGPGSDPVPGRYRLWWCVAGQSVGRRRDPYRTCVS